MSTKNEISDKKKALKEKILDDIKYCERSIDDIRATINNKYFYYDHADSSDSEDDFPSAIDIGPSITQLKLQQAIMKTCLHATQELTSLMILQSEVNVLVQEPKFEGEHPVTEPGMWREVIAECRIDLVPFTMTFFMHTPDRKFGPPSYRGLRVVPVKPAHELELTKSVLNSLKRPSDAVEVVRSYAAGYRSRRTTLARLVNRYTNNALFMEPHLEGGFVMKCADLLEVSWRLENKWSPVAPFHHRMKFDLEFMEESYIKTITQTHKQLLDPTLQTDERTLLLAKIITTCLEARGPIDPESDLESKTTERDNDIDKIESENEKRDSEVMAPPKSLPKKSKHKSKETNTALKRSMDDENGDAGAKKIRNDDPVPKKSIVEANNPRKNKMNDVATESGKKRKISEVNKVSNSKNVKDNGNTEDENINSKDDNKEDQTGNTKPKNTKQAENNAKTKSSKESEDKTASTNSKPKNVKESKSISNEHKSTKNKVTKEAGDIASKEINPTPKNLKESTKVVKEPAKTDSNAIPKTKIVKEAGKNQEKIDSEKIIQKNTKEYKNKDTATKNNTNKEPNAEKGKTNVNKAKNVTTKETVTEKNNQSEKTKTIDKKKPKTVANPKNKDIIDINKDAVLPKSKITENNKNTETNTNKIHDKPKNTNTAKVKNIANTKNDVQATKKASEIKSNIASTKNDEQPKKVIEKKVTNKEKGTDGANKTTDKNIKEKTVNNNVKNDTHTLKKVTEKNATNIRTIDKISQIGKVTEKIVINKPALMKEVPKKVFSSNVLSKKTKEPTISTKNVIKKPIITKLPSHRNSLKPQNPPKIIKAGSTKAISTSNTEKENGGKGSKIPQKKLSLYSEGSSKKNMLRISPRKIPSNFKTTSQNMLKTTNIPQW